MEIIKLSNRHIIFKEKLKGWDLHIHLIRAKHRDYLIDTGIGIESVEPVFDYLAQSTKEIVVINTHHHWDHIMGNDRFPSSVIVSHRLCYQLSKSLWSKSLEQAKNYTNHVASLKLPTLVFDSCLSFEDDGIDLFFTPGHSLDAISVYDRVDKVLNVGDNLGDSFDAIVPSLDSSVDVYCETLAKYQALDFEVCVSGHCGIQKPSIIDKVVESIRLEIE